MKTLIQIYDAAFGTTSSHDGKYLQSFSCEPAPHGTLVTTANRAQALRFENVTAASEYYRQECGFKPEGGRHRPLTAWTVDFIRVPDAVKERGSEHG